MNMEPCFGRVLILLMMITDLNPILLSLLHTMSTKSARNFKWATSNAVC